MSAAEALTGLPSRRTGEAALAGRTPGPVNDRTYRLCHREGASSGKAPHLQCVPKRWDSGGNATLFPRSNSLGSGRTVAAIGSEEMFACNAPRCGTCRYPQVYPQAFSFLIPNVIHTPLGDPRQPPPYPLQSNPSEAPRCVVIERRAHNSRSSELHVGPRFRQRRATIRG